MLFVIRQTAQRWLINGQKWARWCIAKRVGALIVSNWQRGRNNVEIGREAAEMWTIEGERSKQRQSTLNHSDLLLVPGPEAKGNTRDLIGSKLGVSGRHVEFAASVVKTADNMRANGREREADRLEKLLKHNTISRVWSQNHTHNRH